MKTKTFLLATAGPTVDGRTIDDKMLTEMASSYNPATYGARLNIEHIRGLGTEGPFRSYGDVLELSTGEVEVNLNGKIEKRLGLFGVFDVDDSAKALNDAGQKVYPSIEINPNFGGQGFAYLMGCALTDSPAAIGTERLQFNRNLPGMLHVHADKSGIDAAPLIFADADKAASHAELGFFAAATEFLKGFSGQKSAPSGKPPVTGANSGEQKHTQTGGDNAEMLSGLGNLLTGFAHKMDAALADQAKANIAAIEAVDAKFTALSAQIETTKAPGHIPRSPANGNNFSITDC